MKIPVCRLEKPTWVAGRDTTGVNRGTLLFLKLRAAVVAIFFISKISGLESRIRISAQECRWSHETDEFNRDRGVMYFVFHGWEWIWEH